MRAELEPIPTPHDLFVRPARDLADRGPGTGEPRRRTLVSEAILDLDGPRLVRGVEVSDDRDLTSEDLWELSGACAHARRRAVRRPALAQARTAGASLLVAAVAASAAPTRDRTPRTVAMAQVGKPYARGGNGPVQAARGKEPPRSA